MDSMVTHHHHDCDNGCIACLIMVDRPPVSDFGTLLLGDTVATTTVS